jgi:uncharacterized membrane protein (DUF106 family)
MKSLNELDKEIAKARNDRDYEKVKKLEMEKQEQINMTRAIYR